MSTAVLPLNVAALRVNNNDASVLTTQFKGRIARFERAATASTGDQLLQPLEDPSGPANALGVGVHLHWQLPDLFARAEQQELDGAFVFPQAPNRWLVTRALAVADPTTGDPAAPTTHQWIVDSDAVLPALLADRDGITRPAVPFPLPVSATTATPATRYLGRVVDVADWAAAPPVPHLGDILDAHGKPLHLDSVGFVGPGFSAYYPECCSVFGFWDTFADVPGLRQQMLRNAALRLQASYQVIGWVADPTADPLADVPAAATARYDARVAQCRAASVPVDRTPADVVVELLDHDHRLALRPDAVGYTLAADQTLQTVDAPDRTLCAGIVTDLLWDTTADPATSFFLGNTDRTGTPAARWSDSVRLAAGNTAIEALSALVKSDAGDTDEDADVLDNKEFLLNALQFGLLNGIEQKTDRIVDLEELVHASTFARVPGGLTWIIQPPGTDPHSEEEVSLPLPLAEKLATLNSAQKSYDDARAGVEAYRRQLFLDWFRYLRLYLGEITDPNVDLNALVQFAGGELSATVAAGDAAGMVKPVRDPTTQQVTGLEQPAPSGTRAAAVWAAHQDVQQALPSGAGWLLRAVPAPAYLLPNDPVLVIEGARAQPARRNGTAERTAVRVLTDLITTVEIRDGAGTFRVEAADVALDPTPTGPGVPVPAQLGPVIGEAALLMPTLAPRCVQAVARQGGSGNPAVSDPAGFLGAVQAAIGGLNPLTGPSAGLYATVHAAGRSVPANPAETVDVPRRLTVVFSNAGGAAYPPDPIGWSGLALLREFGPTRVDPFLPVFLTWRVAFTPLRRGGVSGQSDYAEDNLTAYFALDADAVDLVPLTTAGVPLNFTTGVPATYGGSTVLSTRPTISLTEQIDRYLQDHSHDPAAAELADIRDRYKARPILSLALSGFTAQQSLRTAIPAVRVQDVARRGRDAVTAAIAAAADNPVDNWYSGSFTNQAPIATGPLAQQNFGPLRAGTLAVTALEVIDAFGQRMALTTPGDVQPLAVTAARSLRPPGASQAGAVTAVLPPRLAVPSRLWFQWLSAGHGGGSPDEFVETNSHPATTPIFGWVVPNHLDDSVAFYDGTGAPIGSFGIEHGDSVYRTRPGNPTNPADDLARDIGPPGAPTGNPHLARLMWMIARAGADFLAGLMSTLLASDGWIHPSSGAQAAALAVLTGRPLALARALVGLRSPGAILPLNPADTEPSAPFPSDVRAQRVRYADRQTSSSANLGAVRVPVRLGDVANLDDGLVGYFLEAGADDPQPPLYSPYGPKDGRNGVRQPHPEPITATLNAPPSIALLLVDPRSAVHATTGILPVQQLTIPADQYETALRGLAVTFPTHPVLRGQAGLIPPLPQLTGLDWSWIRPADGVAVPLRSNATDGSAGTGYSPQVIEEGWLQLRPVPPDRSNGVGG